MTKATARESELVGWWKALFAERTPPKSVLDAHPDYRVNWSELSAAMRRLGWTESPVEMRIVWAELFVAHKLRAWANKLIRATGSDVLVSRETSAARACREAWRRAD